MSGKEAPTIDGHPEQWVWERIEGFIVGTEVNRLALDGEAIYDEPLCINATGAIAQQKYCRIGYFLGS